MQGKRERRKEKSECLRRDAPETLSFLFDIRVSSTSSFWKFGCPRRFTMHLHLFCGALEFVNKIYLDMDFRCCVSRRLGLRRFDDELVSDCRKELDISPICFPPADSIGLIIFDTKAGGFLLPLCRA